MPCSRISDIPFLMRVFSCTQLLSSEAKSTDPHTSVILSTFVLGTGKSEAGLHIVHIASLIMTLSRVIASLLSFLIVGEAALSSASFSGGFTMAICESPCKARYRHHFKMPLDGSFLDSCPSLQCIVWQVRSLMIANFPKWRVLHLY